MERVDPLCCPQCAAKCTVDVTTHGALAFTCRCGFKEVVYGRPPSAAVQVDLARAPSSRTNQHIAHRALSREVLEAVMHRVEQGSTFAVEWHRLGVSAERGRSVLVEAFGRERVNALAAEVKRRARARVKMPQRWRAGGKRTPRSIVMIGRVPLLGRPGIVGRSRTVIHTHRSRAMTTKKAPTKKATKKPAAKSPAKKTTKQEAPKAKKAGPVAIMRGIATVAIAMKLPRRVALAVMKAQGFNAHTAARQFQEVHAGKVAVEISAAEHAELEVLIAAAVKESAKAAEK